MTLRCSSVIPASFWRESSKNSLDNRLRGYDTKAPIRMLEPKRFLSEYLPTIIERSHSS